jgi:hypothetical protein
VLPVMLADSLNSRRAKLGFEARLEATELDIDRLMALSGTSVEEDEEPEEIVDSLKTESIQKREWITSFLDGTFNATIDNFNYGNIEGTDFKGELTFKDNQLFIKGETNAMDGSFDLDGTMFFEDRPHLQAKLDARGLDVTEFFRQSDNFGQEVLTHKNVSGTLNSQIAIFAYFDQAGNFLYDDLIVFAGIGIQDGYLKDFEMLESFSSYVKVQDLKNIKFVNMQNFMQINRGEIYIPAMFIQSNAMNLTISGEHSFENEFDYNMKINAGQVMANKFKKFNPDLEPVKAKNKGFLNLYFNIFGDLENYDYNMKKKDVKKAFDRSAYRKTEIKNALSKAFGDIQLIEEPEDWSDIPEYGNGAELEDEEDAEFLPEITGGGKR